MNEKGAAIEASFLHLIRPQITQTKEKERRKIGREEKKVMVALLLFILATLEMVFEKRKLLLVEEVYLAVNVFTNPARNSSNNIATSLRVC